MSQNTTKNLNKFLGKTPLFAGLTAMQLEELAKTCVIRKYDKGKQIFSEGQIASGIYIVYTGQVKIFKLSKQSKEQLVHIFGVYDVFAEAPMFEGTTMPINCTALNKTTLVIIPKTTLLKLISTEPQIAFKMLAIQAKRLRLLTKTIENLTLHDAAQRLARYLLIKTYDTEKKCDNYPRYL
jgi:CRP/FNR family transcriptional regulator